MIPNQIILGYFFIQFESKNESNYVIVEGKIMTTISKNMA